MAWSASVSEVYPMKAKFLNMPSFVYFSEQSVRVPMDPNIDRSFSSFIWKIKAITTWWSLKKNILHLRSFNKNKLELYYTVDYYRHIFFNTSLIITFFGKFFTISLDMFVWHWRQKHVWLVFFSPMINRKWLQLPPLFIKKKNQWKCKIIRFLPSSWFSAKMAKNVIVVRPFKVWKLFFFSCHWLLIMFISIFYRSVN